MKFLLTLPFLGFLAMASPKGVFTKNSEESLSVDKNLPLNVSQKAVDLIVYYEVGGKDYYNKYLKRPTVPAWKTTASGVTLMFGNDVGHMTHKEIQQAFQGVLSQKQIDLLKSVSGMKGSNAYYNGLPKVKYLISVEYSDAEKVFKKYTLPKFTQQTATAFKLSKDRLHPHSGGALTSIVFNRGPSMSSSSSRKEMRDIRQKISLKKDDAIPSDIRSMKRLWSYKSLKGLHLRRDAEAKLFQEGLDARK
jgi:GH24 family phage-related lysozyme (muramidase)